MANKQDGSHDNKTKGCDFPGYAHSECRTAVFRSKNQFLSRTREQHEIFGGFKTGFLKKGNMVYCWVKKCLVLAFMIVLPERRLCGSLQMTSIDLNNHTIANNVTMTTTEAPAAENNNNGASSRSEIYKMHNNGLMLLHAQSTRTVAQKKSKLFDSAQQVNYHVRKRPKANETSPVSTADKKIDKHDSQVAANITLFKNDNLKRSMIPANTLKSLIQGETTSGAVSIQNDVSPIKSNEKTAFAKIDPIDTSEKKLRITERKITLVNRTKRTFDEHRDDFKRVNEQKLRRKKRGEISRKRSSLISRRHHHHRNHRNELRDRGMIEEEHPIESIPKIARIGDYMMLEAPIKRVAPIDSMMLPLEQYSQTQPIGHIPWLTDTDELAGDQRRFIPAIPNLRPYPRSPEFPEPTAITELKDIPDIPEIENVQPEEPSSRIKGDKAVSFAGRETLAN